jgi:hypothetical protein
MLAEVAVRSEQDAATEQEEQERQAYLRIRAGEEPELADDGSVDYATVLAWYERLFEKNPQAMADAGEDKRAVLQSRLERARVLAGQYGENVRIGREGGKRALE